MAQMLPVAFQRSSMVLTALARRWALSFAKAISNGIEVRAIGRQEQEPCALRPDRFFGPLTFMAGEVVEDDDVAWLEGGRELGFDIGLEDHAVHWGINNPEGDEAFALKARHEGLCAQWPKGALLFNRVPFVERPCRRVIFVTVPVSSMTTSRWRCRA